MPPRQDRGLTIGGDDYVTKPFSVAELVARTQAILRLCRQERPARELLVLADLEMDDDAQGAASRSAHRPDGNRVPAASLPPLEFRDES